MNILKFCQQVLFPFRFYLLGCCCSITLYAIIGSLRPYLTKLLVNAASLGYENLWSIGCYFIVIYFVIPLNWRFYDWCSMNYEPRLKNNIARIVFEQVTKHDYRFFQNNFAGSISAKIIDATSMIPTMVTTCINSYLGNFLSVAIAIVALSSVNIWFGMAMLLWAIFIIIISGITVAGFNTMSKNVAEKSSIIIGKIVDATSNILNLKLFSSRDREIELVKNAQEDYRLLSMFRRWRLFKFYGMQGVSFSLYQCFCLVFLLHLFKEGQVTAGDFVMILMINGWIIDSIWQMSEQMRNFSENFGSVEQALKTFYQPLEVQDKKDAAILQVTKGEIIFDKVQFNYPDAEPIFQNKSVTIAPGQKLGLVGYSGGGKSSFVNLILRLFDVSGGRILIDGQNTADVTQDSLREAISMIPQDPSLFHRSLMDNIRYGLPSATDAQVIEASKLAHAHNFIMALPENYQAMVGERGVKLSGGQRQRIAIARAILKNAPILILDEATSQLDSVTEKDIQEALKILMQGKTVIVVAHRLSTLLDMDRILVLDEGRIVQDGDHKKLLAEQGLYKILWEAQVGGFLPSLPETN